MERLNQSTNSILNQENPRKIKMEIPSRRRNRKKVILRLTILKILKATLRKISTVIQLNAMLETLKRVNSRLIAEVSLSSKEQRKGPNIVLQSLLPIILLILITNQRKIDMELQSRGTKEIPKLAN
jgi:hypothetical protein